MEFYLFILIVLFATAVADLYVGVANDAVNFMNSAIGSKVGSRVAIMITASIGVFVGTTFSTGMMEVARKGIFNPELFTFHEVMIIFLAVMITDIILLDLYNTFALPTSTTVSLVFELVGGAVAMSWLKVQAAGGVFSDIFIYLNTGKIVTIVSSIGVSIILAFIFGVSIQFLTRLIFTFDYEKQFRRYGALYSAAGITAIVYFILVKGAKGSALISQEQSAWISDNMSLLLAGIFLGVTVIFQLFILLTRINVLKIVVFAGTFALALAFAANDLVNFIGSPMGALNAYQIASAEGGDPNTMLMGGLREPVRANIWILLFAGTVMVATLWFSRKARAVTKTEVSLGRQEEGVERFSSSALARALVRMGVGFHDVYKRTAPLTLQRTISERLDASWSKLRPGDDGEMPAFDMLRAGVNLMVASALISVGTALKLPLSTTFVTFMVAMSTSLADKAWGRESAVYRVNGVIMVVGGWFFTAMLAFTACFTFTTAIYYGELPAILGLVFIGFFFYYRTNIIYTKREKDFERKEKKYLGIEAKDFELNSKELAEFLVMVSGVIEDAYEGLIKGNRRVLRNAAFLAKNATEDSEKLISSILDVMRNATDEEKGITPRYGRKIASFQIITANLTSLTNGAFTYVDNNHTPLDDEQELELREVRTLVDGILRNASRMLAQGPLDEIAQVEEALLHLKRTIREFDRRQMKRIRLGKSKTRQSLVFIGTLNKAERIADQALVLLGLYRESARELSEVLAEDPKPVAPRKQRSTARKPRKRSR